MGRAPRPLAPGVTYHVAARGNSGQDIYAEDQDRRRFLRMLGRIAARRRWVVMAYCLMGNHFHLLVTTPEADLSDGMRDLLAGYSRFFNVKYQRAGHLFSQRYLCVVVNTDRQLLIVARYIARNPVRAGLLRSPKDWGWSSHALLARSAPLPNWCNCDVLLTQFHQDRDRSLALLVDYVEDDRLDVPRDAPPEAVSPIARRVPSVAMLRFAMPPSEVIAAAARVGHSQQEIAAVLGISPGAVAQRAYRRRRSRRRGGAGTRQASPR